MEKQTQYQQLVQKRKEHDFKNGLTNPSQTAFDIDEIDPWAQWQNNLEAKILVVGQEFCDVETYKRTEGKVECKLGEYDYPSNENLKAYFDLLGYDLGHPLSPNQSNPIFFTNAVMGLKPGSMSGNFDVKWLEESRELFLKPLIDIIQPKIIIPIGSMATKTLGVIYGFKVSDHKSMVDNAPIKTPQMIVFPVFHTGGLGLRNRPKEQQIGDWMRIKDIMGIRD